MSIQTGHGRNIGRIGALAVALGIGYAMADAPAFARPADNSPSGDSESAATSSTHTSAARNSATRPSATRPSARGPAAAGPSTISPARPTVGQPRPAATAPAADADHPPRSAAGLTPPRLPAGRDTRPDRPSGRHSPSAAIPAVTLPGSAAELPSSTAVVAAAIPTGSATAVSAAVSVSAVPQSGGAVVPALTATMGRTAAPTAQLTAAAPSPLAGSGPHDSPAAASLLWTALAWTRRESGRASVRSSAAALTTTSLAQSPNLLMNPGAEVGDPSLSGFSSVTIPGWAVSGVPTVIKYGTPRNAWPIGTSFKMPDLPSFMGFPKAGSGPADGGAQFFGGGDVATGTLTQTVDLRGAAADIDLGAVTYTLSGWLGGYLLDPSAASVNVSFLDSNRTYLGSTEIGPVSILDRWLQTGLKQRTASGVLPEGTRYARVELTLQDCNVVKIGFAADYNGAFADNLSFTIGADLPAPPAPTPPVSTVGELDHVIMVYMENKGYDDIVGSPNAPFLNSLINAYGLAGAYHGLTHPSLPNYYPIIGGSDFGLTYNCASPCIDAETTLVSNIEAAGKTWSGYAQSMPAPGTLEPVGDYSPEQLPFFAFSSIANDPARAALVKPLEQMAIDLSSPATAPNFAWFAANEDFNGEGPVDFPWGALKFAISQLEVGNPYNIPALDQFLSETVPVVLNSAVWQDPNLRSALFVTFDEDNNNTSLGFGNDDNQVVMVVIPSPGAVTAGMRSGPFVVTDYYNHYSLLRTIEESLGITARLTNNDTYAQPMNGFWDGTASGTGLSAL